MSLKYEYVKIFCVYLNNQCGNSNSKEKIANAKLLDYFVYYNVMKIIHVPINYI